MLFQMERVWKKSLRSEGLCRVGDVGSGEIVSIDCRSFYELVEREIAKDPWITARGPAGDPLELENSGTGGKKEI